MSIELDHIYCMNELELLSQLPTPPKLIVTDPPYGINYQSKIAGSKQWNKNKKPVSKFGRLDKIKNDDNSINFDDVFAKCYEVMDDDAHLIVCSGWSSLSDWLQSIKKAGFAVRNPIYWNKKCANGGSLSDPPINVVETMIRATKGNPQCYPVYNEKRELKQRIVNVWNYGRVKKKEYAGHPTQKPVILGQQLIRMSTTEGDLVVDPYCGSGSFLVAAKQLKRHYIGGDIHDPYVEISKNRLAGNCSSWGEIC